MTSKTSRWVSATPVLVLIGLCLAVALVDPRFLSIGNMVRIAAAASAPLVLALGATFIILMGSIDLSIEGSMAFTAAVLAALVANASGSGLDLGLAALPFTLLAAAAFGLVTGLVHVHLKVPSFMASLGMGFVGVGVATVILGGERVGILDQNIRALALTRALGLPLSVYVGLLMLAVAWFIQDHTRIGRHIMALGGGEDLAAASGINVKRVRVLAFTIAGAFFGVGAVLACARLGASSALIGSGQLFTAISAVVVGGTALTGGKGGVLQTVLGVLIVVVLNNGMIILGLPSFVQQGVLGLAIILAVLLNSPRRTVAIIK
ncbi:ABC transporter permease [Sinorhizobium fredii]|uniref:ABC transporter permease n=1 Tax=Rhizobium fredii TaxID=380 RepID=A0A2A6M6X4_RHIFR|nr:ABC transporter permease [Sinorhizobium fredii]PDT50139.1 ABC transporter permease [Sinorhizobium fredii]